MRQLLLNSIEIKRIIDVGSTTYFYLLIPSAATAPNKPADNSAPPIYETEGYSGWSETEPRYTSGDTRSLYVTIRTTYSDGSCKYTTPSLSSSYEAAKQAYNRAQSALNLADGINNYFWWLTSSTDSDIPTGAYVTNVSKASFETNKTGGNIVIQSTGITIRNGVDTLASLSGQALNFYETNNGYLTMSLNGNSLNFYNPTNNNNDISAQLNATGLVLKKGGIESGSVTSGNGYVYLSTEDKSGITINGHTPGANDPAWRAIIGTKFGVDAEGNLYASSGSIGSSITIGGLEQSEYLNSNIQIGGRNLAKATGTPSILTAATNQYWFSPAFAYTSDYGKALLANTDNTTFTVSYDYAATGLNGSITLRTLLQKDNGIYGIGTIIKGQHPVLSSENSSGHVEITFEPEEGHREFGGMWMLMSNNNTSEKSAMAAATITITNFKFEIGTNATDWTPAPEDIQAEIDAKKSIHTLTTNNTAGKTYTEILALAAEGAQNTFTVTESTAGIKVGDTVRIKYLANDMGTGGTWVYIIGTIRIPPSTNAVAITAHGLDTTVIDGGHILTGTIDADRIGTNSITASKLRIGDYNNYITATENDEKSLVSGVIFEETSTIDEDTLVTSWIYKHTSSSSNLWVSPIVNNWTKEGEQYRITGKLKIPEDGRVGIAIQGRDSNGDFVTNNIYSISGISANEEVDINGIITISAAVAECAKCNIGIYFYKGSSGSTYQVGYCRQMRLERISSFITAIDEDGIKIHASDSTNTNYIQLDNENLQIYSNGNSVAQYGNSSRIGLEFGAHFVIDSNKLQAYNSSNELYFQVTDEGISFGNDTVATQTEVNNRIASVQEDIAEAGKTATSFITNLGNDGIKIHSANDSTDSILINSKHIIMYRNNTDVMQLTDSALRIGAENSGHVSLQSNELGFYDGASKVAYVGSDKLFIENSEITDTLRVGQFLWKVHANNANRISLVYEPITT